MSRQPRVVLPGHLHHVTQRGNYQQCVFLDDNDRIQYLKYIEEYCRKYSVEIYAYCLMSNHVHFIVNPSERTSLARAFDVAHQRYSYYFHKKNKAMGHLWQARFYSCSLHGSHAREAVRYVERNPVRARMVKRPWDYSWSSARAHLGTAYRIISLADIRKFIDVSCWKDYLIKTEKDDDLKKIREATNRGMVVGPEKFISELEKILHRSLVVRPRGRPPKEK